MQNFNLTGPEINELKQVIIVHSTPIVDIVPNVLVTNASFGSCILFSMVIFLIGLFRTLLNSNSLLNVLFSIEIMLLGLTLTFTIIAKFTGSPIGYIYASLILALAAAESVIGLGLLIISYRLENNITFQAFNRLKG